MGRKDKAIRTEELVSVAQKLGAKMRQARQAKGLSLTEMAEIVGYTKSLLSSVENGRVKPTQQLLEKYERVLDLSSGVLKSVLDGERISQGRRSHNLASEGVESVEMPVSIQKDLGEAPAVKHFYGRERELAELKQWLLKDHCTLLSIFGIGGVGKTTLASYLVSQVAVGGIRSDFEFVFWRSLQNAPSIENILEQMILFLSEGQQSDLPEEEDARVALFTNVLSKHRCLVVLDNFEAVLKSNNPVGQYKDEYVGYGKLIQRVGEGDHRSCLLLTSREKPGEILRLEGRSLPVRSMEVFGIEQLEAIEHLLRGEDLVGTAGAWQEFIRRYAGNPLALKLIASYIREIFGGSIASFLEEGEAAFGDVSDLLEQQFQRLSLHERDIMYWLAIQCEAVSLEALAQDVLPVMTRIQLIAAIGSLRRRFMIEVPSAKNFVLQPVITEYVTNKFVERVCREITSGKLDIFASHALINAQARDYVRRDQERHILQPIAERLVNTLGKEGVERVLRGLLDRLREEGTRKPTYTAGNILNLLVYLNNGHVNKFDFSHLVIRQAYLQGVTLHRVSFAYADIQASIFRETFKDVLSIAISPEGKLLAAGTDTGEIQLRDAVTGELKLTFGRGDASWVCWSVAFSPNEEVLASGSEDQLIRLWDVETGNLLSTLEGHTSWVKSIAFSPDGSILASGSYDNTVRLWDVETGECLMILAEHTGPVHSVAFNQNGTMLASGSDDKSIRLWNVGNKQSIRTLKGGDGHVFAVCFTPDGSWLASGGGDHDIHIWDSETGEHLFTLKGHTDQILSLAFSHDGSILASGSEDQTIRVWKIRTGEILRVLQGHADGVWSIAFGLKDEVLASGSLDHTIRLWDIYHGRCLRELQGYTNTIRSIAFSARRNLLATGGESGTLHLWSLHTDGQPRLYKALQRHKKTIRSVAFSPDGSLLASGGEDKIIRLWDANRGVLLNELPEHSTWVKSVAFSPDGNLLASGSVGQSIRLWSVESAKCLKTISGHTSQVRAVTFSPDGQLLASGSDDKTIRLWDIRASGYGCVKILRGHSGHVWSVVFSPDGQLLASGSDDKTIRLWETSTGRCIRILEAKSTNWVGSLAFSPEGDMLASGHGDQTVRLWEVSSGEAIKVLYGHTNVVYTIAFSADGLLLASSGRDGVTYFWSTRTWEYCYTVQDKRPYEGLNIMYTTGLNEAQRRMLRALGAFEEGEFTHLQ